MDIVELDPRHLGKRTKVNRLWKVEDGRTVCYVFDQRPRYPIFCMEHGVGCDAVREILRHLEKNT
jgi:hypothetical protein